jgi:hypothetical protein
MVDPVERKVTKSVVVVEPSLIESMEVSSELITAADNNPDILQKIVTGDET